MEQPKRPRGGQPKPPELRLEQRSIRLLPAHWEKIEAAGMKQFRALIDRWKPKARTEE